MQVIDPYFDSLYKSYELTITNDIYGTLLGTVTGMGAVLIGLYYAATTAIGGAIYARVPNNIRDLLARDRVGNVYMRYLAFTTYIGIVLLAFRAAGLPPVKIAIPFFILTSGISIMSFVGLGARAFYLFDPTTLSYGLFKQLKQNYLQMTPGEYRWLDPSFQRHAHQASRSALDTLSTLATITATEAHLSGQPFLTLCRQLLSFAIAYEPEKKRIPTDSLWYSKQYVHADWYQSGDSETSLASAGTFLLNPKEVSDTRWLENEILPIAYSCIKINLQQERYTIAIELLNYIDAYVRTLSREHEVAAALRVLSDLTSACGDLLLMPESKKRESLERLSIADTLASIPISIFLAYAEALKEAGRNSILTAAKKIDWKHRKKIYQTGLPIHLLRQLEWIQPRLEFEILSEGKQVSPNWYVGELIIQQACENAKETADAIIGGVRDIYDNWLQAADRNKLLWIGATLLSRETEYWGKVEYQLWRLREHWVSLNEGKKIEGLPWASLDFDGLDRDREQRKKILLALTSKNASGLSLEDRPDNYPDFAGRFLHAAGEAIFTAMCDNDANTVDSIFPDFFNNSLLQFNRILAKATGPNWRLETTIKIAVAPVLDLMALSGYSILLSELNNNPALSGSILRIWNRYLDAADHPGSGSKISFLAGAISITESSFELAHRSLIRTNWMQRISGQLQGLERRPVRHKYDRFVSQTVAAHDSALVRVLARDGVRTFYDGIDIFLEKCIRARADGKSVDFGYRRSQLGQALAREETRAAEEAAKDEE